MELPTEEDLAGNKLYTKGFIPLSYGILIPWDSSIEIYVIKVSFWPFFTSSKNTHIDISTTTNQLLLHFITPTHFVKQHCCHYIVPSLWTTLQLSLTVLLTRMSLQLNHGVRYGNPENQGTCIRGCCGDTRDFSSIIGLLKGWPWANSPNLW